LLDTCFVNTLDKVFKHLNWQSLSKVVTAYREEYIEIRQSKTSELFEVSRLQLWPWIQSEQRSVQVALSTTLEEYSTVHSRSNDKNTTIHRIKNKRVITDDDDDDDDDYDNTTAAVIHTTDPGSDTDMAVDMDFGVHAVTGSLDDLKRSYGASLEVLARPEVDLARREVADLIRDRREHAGDGGEEADSDEEEEVEEGQEVEFVGAAPATASSQTLSTNFANSLAVGAVEGQHSLTMQELVRLIARIYQPSASDHMFPIRSTLALKLTIHSQPTYTQRCAHRQKSSSVITCGSKLISNQEIPSLTSMRVYSTW
jgi:hypothetical protein